MKTAQKRIDEIIDNAGVLEFGAGEMVFCLGGLVLLPGLAVWGEADVGHDPFFNEFQFHSMRVDHLEDDGEEITFVLAEAVLEFREVRLVPIELSSGFGGDDLDITKSALEKFRKDLKNGDEPGWNNMLMRAIKMAKEDAKNKESAPHTWGRGLSKGE